MHQVLERCVLFDDTLSRATAAINRGTRTNNPILTPRIPKLGDVGWTVKVEAIAKPRRPSQLNYSYNTNQNVAYFDLVSETHLSAFQQIIDDPTIQGIIIGAFGAGNTPAKLIPAIYDGVYNHGKAIGVITNCKKGSSDMGLYDCGALAVKAGAISLGPMTKPAAVEKMRYALNNAHGEDRFEYLQDVARLLLTSIAEELPENFSRHAVNKMREQFSKKPEKLENFFNAEVKKAVFNYEIQTYCRSKEVKHKVLVVSVGGTFFQEPNVEGALTPTKRKLGELFDLKLKELHRLVSLDYMELANLDSTDLGHPHRVELARVIARNVEKYDGFVVLHGTDTLAFSASAVSYMLVGIEKDVVFTGSQRPGFGSSDFDRNFIKAVKVILTRLALPEKDRPRATVRVAFGDKLMIGATVIKEDEHGMNAFAPVEKHPLNGKLSHQVEIYDITKHVKKRPFTLFTAYDTNVAYFECISAVDIKQFEGYIENPDVSAILIGGYDEGNMPMQMKYYIATAVNSYGKPICFISNNDNGVCEVGARGRNQEFIRAGAIALGDMIKESAFQKLCFACGVAKKQQGLVGREKIEFVRKIMHTNLVGEITEKYCQDGDRVYKGIFTNRVFSDDEIQKTMLACQDVLEKEQETSSHEKEPSIT